VCGSKKEARPRKAEDRYEGLFERLEFGYFFLFRTLAPVSTHAAAAQAA
jgi:hypothetical protein